jgi:hypothetical protein
MTDRKKPNKLPSVLTYDDVRAVSPALKHYTEGELLDGLWKRPLLSHRVPCNYVQTEDRILCLARTRTT